MSLATLLLIAALICFIVSCVTAMEKRFNWIGAGLAFWVSSILFAGVHLH